MLRKIEGVIGTLIVLCGSALVIVGIPFTVRRLFPESMTKEMLYIVLLLAFAGALGGFARGLVESKGRFRFCSFKVNSELDFDLGAISDMLVGLTGPLAIFFVFAGFFQIKLQENLNHLQLIGLGVLAGYASKTILIILARQMERQLEGRVETVEKKVEEGKETDLEIAFATARASWLAGDYQSSLMIYESILKRFPENVRALLGQGASFVRLTNGEERAVRLGLRNCTLIIERLNPKEELAWYNRACYKCLLGESEAAVLEDLRRSVSLNASTFQTFIEKDLRQGGHLARLNDSIRRDPELAPYVRNG